MIDKKRNGEIIFTCSNIFEIKGYSNESIGYIAINTDTTNKIRREEEITRVHKYNFQTWLPNKEFLLEKMRDVIARNLDNIHAEYALIVIKINKMHELPIVYDFEKINFIIKEIIDRITKITENAFFVSRIAEDEFALFGCFNFLSNIEEIFIDDFFCPEKD